eukprot:763170-Hanusia_phi.AAC.5
MWLSSGPSPNPLRNPLLSPLSPLCPLTVLSLTHSLLPYISPLQLYALPSALPSALVHSSPSQTATAAIPPRRNLSKNSLNCYLGLSCGPDSSDLPRSIPAMSSHRRDHPGILSSCKLETACEFFSVPVSQIVLPVSMRIVTPPQEALCIVNGTQKYLILFEGDWEETMEPGIAVSACTESGVEYAELELKSCWKVGSDTGSQRLMELCGCENAADFEHFLEKKRNQTQGGSEGMIVVEVAFKRLVSASLFESSQFWSRMSADKIPSKKHLHPSFIRVLEDFWKQRVRFRMLDLGCGDGHVALQLLESAEQRGGSLDVLGVDVCDSAVTSAREMAQGRKIPEFGSVSEQTSISFLAHDVTELDIAPTHGLFDVVLCQLVISVVGGKEKRKHAMKGSAGMHFRAPQAGARDALVGVGGFGACQRIVQDEALTGEYRSYYSRGPEGQVYQVRI